MAGLACAAAVATPIVEFLFLMVNKGLWKLAPQDPNTWQKWMSSESYRFIFTASGALGYSLQLLIGSFVWISIAPIASWRGSLSRRFVISVGMALGIYCVLTGVDFHLSTRSLYARIPVVVAQGLCWLSLPYIMVLPIFREKRGLRMITGGGIILLSASVSFASVSSVHTFQWRMMELGIGLCICQIFGLWVCVLRRQAMVEAGMSDSSIARTTSLTLLELTTIVGLMVAVLSPLLMGWAVVLEYTLGGNLYADSWFESCLQSVATFRLKPSESVTFAIDRLNGIRDPGIWRNRGKLPKYRFADCAVVVDSVFGLGNSSIHPLVLLRQIMHRLDSMVWLAAGRITKISRTIVPITLPSCLQFLPRANVGRLFPLG